MVAHALPDLLSISDLGYLLFSISDLGYLDLSHKAYIHIPPQKPEARTKGKGSAVACAVAPLLIVHTQTMHVGSCSEHFHVVWLLEGRSVAIRKVAATATVTACCSTAIITFGAMHQRQVFSNLARLPLSAADVCFRRWACRR